MDIVPYLSAVILITTIFTLLLAVGSYVAFKMRNRRKPQAEVVEEVAFFHRYRHDEYDDPDEFEETLE